MKRVPFDSQVPSDALRIEVKIFSQIHSRFQHLFCVEKWLDTTFNLHRPSIKQTSNLHPGTCGQPVAATTPSLSLVWLARSRQPPAAAADCYQSSASSGVG